MMVVILSCAVFALVLSAAALVLQVKNLSIAKVLQDIQADAEVWSAVQHAFLQTAQMSSVVDPQKVAERARNHVHPAALAHTAGRETRGDTQQLLLQQAQKACQLGSLNR